MAMPFPIFFSTGGDRSSLLPEPSTGDSLIPVINADIE